MFTEDLDEEQGLAIWLLSGSVDTDADYEELIAAFERADAAVLAPGIERPAVLQIVDDGNPVPNSFWRRRIAQATAHPHGRDAMFALVTSSLLVRGVVSAINWLRPPRYHIGLHASVDDAVAWVERARPGCAARLRSLYAEARQKTELASAA